MTRLSELWIHGSPPIPVSALCAIARRGASVRSRACFTRMGGVSMNVPRERAGCRAAASSRGKRHTHTAGTIGIHAAGSPDS